MTESHRFSKGVAFMFLSSLGLSLVGLFGKMALSMTSLEEVVFSRFFCAFILCFIFFLFIKKLTFSWKATSIKLNLCRAFLVLGAQYSFYFYIQHGSLMNGTTLLSTGPLFIPLFERVFLGRKMGRSTWISLLVSFLGVLLILQPDRGLFKGMGWIGFCAGIFQGGSQVMLGVSSKREDMYSSVLMLFAGAALISFFPFIFKGAKGLSHSLSNSLILLSLGLGIASVMNMLSRSWAYNLSTPSRLASFLYFSVILAGIYDWWFFASRPNVLSYLGAFLVVLGGLLKVYLRRKILKI